jgi:hypothetical protein
MKCVHCGHLLWVARGQSIFKQREVHRQTEEKKIIDNHPNWGPLIVWATKHPVFAIFAIIFLLFVAGIATNNFGQGLDNRSAYAKCIEANLKMGWHLECESLK